MALLTLGLLATDVWVATHLLIGPRDPEPASATRANIVAGTPEGLAVERPTEDEAASNSAAASPTQEPPTSTVAAVPELETPTATQQNAPTAAAVAPPTAAAAATAAPTPEPVMPTPPPATAEPPPPPVVAAEPDPAVVAVADPVDAVAAFYGNVADGDFDVAYSLWSDRMTAAFPRQGNLDDRFANTASITFHELYVAEMSGDRATVQANFTETYDSGASRVFIGYWELIRVDGRWLLDAPHY